MTGFIGLGTASLTAVLGYSVVFIGLVALMLVTMIVGRVMVRIQPKAQPTAVPKAAIPSAAPAAASSASQQMTEADIAALFVVLLNQGQIK